MLDVSFIILTYNEEIHIRRCLLNALKISNKIFIVDSYSTDNTIKIAKEFGVAVFQNKWENNYAQQFNWALDNLPLETKWVFRLDADEYLTEELVEELHLKLDHLSSDVTGIAFPLKRVFLNKHIRKGIIKLLLLRLFKYGDGRCEQKWMDEHIYLSNGVSVVFNSSIVDHNLQHLGWWTEKHNAYSIREAIDLLNIELDLVPQIKQNRGVGMALHAAKMRSNKLKYIRLPLFWRAFFLFLYRYFIKLGFTDGKEAFLWHFLQGWWYRCLVDAKIYEIKKNCGNDKSQIINYVKNSYGIELK